MKKILLAFLIILMFSFNSALSYSVKYQKWYTKKNWTYVQWHYKTTKNSVKSDNFSSKGNMNPYTWKKGTKKY